MWKKFGKKSDFVSIEVKIVSRFDIYRLYYIYNLYVIEFKVKIEGIIPYLDALLTKIAWIWVEFMNVIQEKKNMIRHQ